jgi:P-type Cu+ transporter
LNPNPSVQESLDQFKEIYVNHHDAMSEQPGQATDPVCGMAIDPKKAAADGLATEYEGKTYFFCGRGCKLEFTDDPARFLDPSYHPSM